MKTKTTLLAALLLAGASQAALAQDRDHGDRAQAQDRAAVRGGPAPAVAPHPAPAPAAPAIAPQGGHARFGPPPGAAGPAVAPAPHVERGGDRHDGGERHLDRGGGANFAPGAAGPGDRHWDRRDVPREITPPAAGEHGWDREHDGHAPDPRRLQHDGRDDGRWDRDHDRDRDRDHDHRGPPPNWQRWERGRFPPIFAAPHRFRISPYRAPYGFYVRSWGFGDFLPRGWFGPSYWVDDFYDYDLPWPPPGYHWVRVGPDVLLVDDYSGRIVQVVRDLFW